MTVFGIILSVNVQSTSKLSLSEHLCHVFFVCTVPVYNCMYSIVTMLYVCYVDVCKLISYDLSIIIYPINARNSTSEM